MHVQFPCLVQVSPLIGKLLKIIRRQKRSSSINFSNLSPFSIFIFISILAIITQTWVKPIETKITQLHNLDQCYVTTNSLWDGIVLWEMLEQKCQQRVCQHTDVVQTGQAGWMVLILHWKMVKFTERSALVIALLVANTQQIF